VIPGCSSVFETGLRGGELVIAGFGIQLFIGTAEGVATGEIGNGGEEHVSPDRLVALMCG